MPGKSKGDCPDPKKPGPKKGPAKKPAARKPAAKKKSPVKPVKKASPPPANPAQPKPAPGGYAAYRDSQAELSRERSTVGREIGPLPAVADPARREACRVDLRLFCQTYLAGWFYLGWSPPHLRALKKLQACVTDGGLFAEAFPRGDGKTTMAEAGTLWALLYGWRKFVVIVAANKKPLADTIIDELKDMLETNDLLLADFPEVCYPVRMLERVAQRANGQTLDGTPTRMTWTGDEIAFAMVPGSAAAGGAIRAVGITGAVRGAKRPGPDGQSVRPDMVLLDDPQDRESAKSPTQTADRLAVVRGDVLGLAGPDKTIAAVMACTVIYPNDLADQLLDHQKNPEWQGEKTKTLLSFPTDMAAWDGYWEVRSRAIADGRGRGPGDEFYVERRAAMDAGAEVYWAARVRDGDLSAVQSAMNLYYRDRRAFYAEYQNEPEANALAGGAKELCAPAIAARLSGVERHQVPAECTRLTAFIDCGLYLHWWAVVAWTEQFGGSVIDYGCWPRQARSFFSADDARPKLGDHYAGLTPAQLVWRGLEDVAGHVLGRAYFRQGGTGELRVERCLVDSGYETKAVYQWVRQSAHAGVVYPSKGRAETTTASGIATWKVRPGERAGYHWRLTAGEERRVKSVQFDPDRWKSFLFGALTTPLGGAGGLTLYGREARDHEMVAHHLAAEYSEPVTIRGVTFDKWRPRPDRPDNHLLDCVVGAAVAASVAGLTWSASPTGEAPKPKSKRPPPRPWSEMMRERQAGRS